MARLFIRAGRHAIRPADIVGAITNETGITSSELGAIELRDRLSLVEVPLGTADQIVKSMRKATLAAKRCRFDGTERVREPVPVSM